MHSPVKDLNIKPYLTYRVLYPSRPQLEKNDIIKYIKYQNADILLMGLSMLTRCSKEMKSSLEMKFYVCHRPDNDSLLYRSSIHYELFSMQTLMVAMKWLIFYGNFHGVNKLLYCFDDRKNEILIESIYFSIIIADTIHDDLNQSKDRSIWDNAVPHIQKNAYINTNDISSLQYAIVRSLVFFLDIPEEKSFKEDKDYIDIHSTFFYRYGYSLEEYLSQIMVLCLFEDREGPPVMGKYYSFIPKVLEQYIEEGRFNDLTIDLNDARGQLEKGLDDNYSLKLFWQYLFLRTSENSVIAMNFEPYINKVFINLKFYVAGLYEGKKKNQCLAFMGKIQERYIYEMIKESLDTKSVKVYPEMFFDSNTNKTPDTMIDIGGKILLVIESKNQSVKEKALFHDDVEAYIVEEKRLALKPLEQTLKCLEKMADSHSPELNKIDIKSFHHIYLFSVINEGFNVNPYRQPAIHDAANTMIQSFFPNKKIKGYFTVGVSQLEKIISWLFTNQFKVSPKIVSKKLDALFQSSLSIDDFSSQNGIRLPDVRYLAHRERYLKDLINVISRRASNEIK